MLRYCGDDKNHVLVINLDPLTPAINTPAHADYDLQAVCVDDLDSLGRRLDGLSAGHLTLVARAPEPPEPGGVALPLCPPSCYLPAEIGLLS